MASITTDIVDYYHMDKVSKYKNTFLTVEHVFKDGVFRIIIDYLSVKGNTKNKFFMSD
jgi:hypothetical protein